MGCLCSKAAAEPREIQHPAPKRAPKSRKFKKAAFKTDEPWTEAELQAKREEFWDTAPHYGGDRVIWDALRAACDADLATAKVILESAGVVVASDNMTVCYDERGRKYELPKYVISTPRNVKLDGKGGTGTTRQVELTAGGGSQAAGGSV